MKNQYLFFLLVIISISTLQQLKATKSEFIEAYAYSFAEVNHKMNEYSGLKYKKVNNFMKAIPSDLNKNLRNPTAVVADNKEKDELSKDYYDGSMKLISKEEIKFCRKWTTKAEACQSQKSCGWCSSENRCIPGTEKGPLIPCSGNSFRFSDPPQNWNFFPSDIEVTISHEKIDGSNITKITPKKPENKPEKNDVKAKVVVEVTNNQHSSTSNLQEKDLKKPIDNTKPLDINNQSIPKTKINSDEKIQKTEEATPEVNANVQENKEITNQNTETIPEDISAK